MSPEVEPTSSDHGGREPSKGRRVPAVRDQRMRGTCTAEERGHGQFKELFEAQDRPGDGSACAFFLLPLMSFLLRPPPFVRQSTTRQNATPSFPRGRRSVLSTRRPPPSSGRVPCRWFAKTISVQSPPREKPGTNVATLQHYVKTPKTPAGNAFEHDSPITTREASAAGDLLRALPHPNSCCNRPGTLTSTRPLPSGPGAPTLGNFFSNHVPIATSSVRVPFHLAIAAQQGCPTGPDCGNRSLLSRQAL